MKKILVPGLIAGVAMVATWVVLSFVLNNVLPSIKMEYSNPGLFRPWSDPLMLLIYLHPFLVGLLLAWLWGKTKSIVPGSGYEKGLKFGFAYWLVTSIPGMFISYSTFPVSFTMIFSWSLSGLIQALVAGVVLVKFSK